MSAAGGPAAVAAVLNLMQGTMEKEILAQVAARDLTLSEQIKHLMFVFEDVIGLDDKSVQRILRDVDNKTLALALKGASAELRTRIIGQMSQRASQALADEMEMLGPVRMRDVETAQMGIVAQIRTLEESGEVVLGASADDLVS
jgi:flagellar motor switch protein FliG